MEHLRCMFELLSQGQWKLKLSKCTFAQTKISYLSHVISAAGVETDPSKLESIAAWPTPVQYDIVVQAAWRIPVVVDVYANIGLITESNSSAL